MLSCCSNAETTQGSDDVAGGVEAVANRDTVAGNNEPESSCTDSSFGGNLFQVRRSYLLDVFTSMFNAQ